jgi:hypothetical protein
LQALPPKSVDADLLTVFALAFSARFGATCVTWLFVAVFAVATFVDLAIAVVVDAVTFFFFGGADFSLAGAPLTVLTGLLTSFANADALGFGGAVVTSAALAVYAVRPRWAACRRLVFLDTCAVCTERTLRTIAVVATFSATCE